MWRIPPIVVKIAVHHRDVFISIYQLVQLELPDCFHYPRDLVPPLWDQRWVLRKVPGGVEGGGLRRRACVRVCKIAFVCIVTSRVRRIERIREDKRVSVHARFIRHVLIDYDAPREIRVTPR